MSDEGLQQPSLSVDPAEGSSGLGGAMRIILRKAFQQMEFMQPAVVIAVDTKRQFCTVQPQVMMVGTDGTTYSRAQIQKVPIFNAGAGGYVMSFPVKVTGFGWLYSADRDISLFIQKGAEAAPNTLRQHSFSDGVFVPDAMREWALADEDAANAVWQSYDGTTKITLGPDQIKILHPTKVLVDCPQVEMTGDLVVDGTITGKTDVLAGTDNISGKGHTHPVMGSETGEPNA